MRSSWLYDVVRGCGGDADILGETGWKELVRAVWLVLEAIEVCTRQESWRRGQYIGFCSLCEVSGSP